MAMKPLFYMLAKHGPWTYHVRVKSTDIMDEIVMWLARQNKAQDVDFEVLVENIEHRGTRAAVLQPIGLTRRGNPAVPHVVKSVEPIMFFNDASLATYIKLTWGGR